MKLNRLRMLGPPILLVLSSSLAPTAQAPKAGAPRMSIEPSEHDFGRTRQDQKLVHQFLITNTGTEDLEIRRIATSCGCTAAVTAARIVPPGGSTTLEVTLETRQYKGAIERSISVASNAPERVSTVMVKAFVEVPEP